MNLPDDEARCNGKKVHAENPLHQECDDCARLAIPPSNPEWVLMDYPPEFIEGRCPERIAE